MPKAAADRSIEHLAWIRFGKHDEFGNAVHFACRVDHEDDGTRVQQRDWCKVLHNVESLVGIDELIRNDRHRGKEYGVTVFGGARDVCGGDARSGTRLVLDDDLLAEKRSCAFGENPPGNICRGSRREPDDDVNRTRRISVLRQGKPGWYQCRKAEYGRGPPTDFRHCSLPTKSFGSCLALCFAPRRSLMALPRDLPRRRKCPRTNVRFVLELLARRGAQSLPLISRK